MLEYTIAVMNSIIAPYILNALNPTLQLNVGEVLEFPLVLVKDKNRVERISKANVELAKSDWDSFETSWDFRRHPLLPRRADGRSEKGESV